MYLYEIFYKNYIEQKWQIYILPYIHIPISGIF